MFREPKKQQRNVIIISLIFPSRWYIYGVLFIQCVSHLFPTLTHTRNSILERGKRTFRVRMLSRILNGCLMWFWTSAKKTSLLCSTYRKTIGSWTISTQSQWTEVRTRAQWIFYNAFKRLRMFEGEKHTKEHESRRATDEEEETLKKSVRQQQQHNIIITHITSRSEKSHSFSTRNAL